MTWFKRLALIPCLLVLCGSPRVQAQLLVPAKQLYSRADTLRGKLTPLRTCYDIQYYHLQVRVQPDERFISGQNLFRFRATQAFNRLQFDLFDNLKVERVEYQGQDLPYTRVDHAVFVDFPRTIPAGAVQEFTVHYSGHPIQARRAPWDGGFDFKKDKNGQHWIATAVQKMGASAWWPNKDHLSDEVDSMLVSVSVPKGLVNVSNGRFRGRTDLDDGYTRYDWFVSNPINNYNISLNIGDYVHFRDSYQGENGKLDLDFWVLRENKNKAFAYLSDQAKKTLEAFEYWFGPYPFYEDSYKLVETAHLGMEHQSAIAYGNGYRFGYLGRDLSGSGWGLKWDFIVVHESGHEWFGNNITCKDLADMWIHEAFTNYSESLFVDYFFGKDAANAYVNGNRKSIQNDTPLQGPYGVNQEGSGDMYNKGGVLLHMVRHLIDDDLLWRRLLREMNAKFFHQTVDYEDIVNFICEKSQLELLRPVFEQYVKHSHLPVLEYRVNSDSNQIECRWKADVDDFSMPIRVKLADGSYEWFHPNSEFQVVALPGLNPLKFEVDTYNFYFELVLLK